jgi:4-hydroxy-tetrahydrodipicolinate synthase
VFVPDSESAGVKPDPQTGGTAPPRTRRRLHGVVTALVTPLRSNRELDHDAFAQLIERQLAAGVDGLFVLGSVGEGPLLPDATFRAAAQCAATVVADRCLLLGGASDNSVERCGARLRQLAHLGVRAGVVTLPFYGWPPRVDESIAFFRDVAAQSPIPVVAYDLPKAVGWQMPPAVLEALFDLPNVIGLKSTHGDFDAMVAVCGSVHRPAHFSFLPGNSRFAARLAAHGADGVVSTPSNVFPEPFVALDAACVAGDSAAIERIDTTMVPALARLIEVLPTGAASIKAALEVQGLASRFTVPPWPEANDSDMNLVRAALEDVHRATG